jgi:hypothetical protein
VETVNNKIEQLIEKSYALQQQASRQGQDLQAALRQAVEREHGRVVAGGYCPVIVREPEVQARLERLAEAGAEDEVRRLLLQTLGACTSCGVGLRWLGEDACPDKPGCCYARCFWCREHAGKTHCFDCLARLQESDDGWCRICAAKFEAEDEPKPEASRP